MHFGAARSSSCDTLSVRHYCSKYDVVVSLPPNLVLLLRWCPVFYTIEFSLAFSFHLVSPFRPSPPHWQQLDSKELHEDEGDVLRRRQRGQRGRVRRGRCRCRRRMQRTAPGGWGGGSIPRREYNEAKVVLEYQMRNMCMAEESDLLAGGVARY